MNIYDFDETIYKYDSSIKFYLYCLKIKKWLILIFPIQFFAFCFSKLHLIEVKKHKELFFLFVKHIKDIDNIVESFWDIEEKNIEQWYLDISKHSDIVISASPEFLLKPICRRLSISSLIATDMNKKTGKILGENCKGEEKVKRLYQQFGYITVDKFYSDSRTDTPMALIAKESFFVKNGVSTDWFHEY